MQDELISKKDLLNEMSISYGQLYRWKRNKLIPEEWFIKKSVSTGQETFFPRKKIIERVQTILECKDGISLDELAYKFSKNIKDILINKTYIIDKNIVSSSIVNLFEEFMGSNEKYDEKSLLAFMVFKEMIDSGFLSMDEMKKISLKIKEVYERLGSDDYILSVKRKYGVSFVVLNKEKEEIIVDDEAKAILEIDLGKIMDEIKRISQG